MNPPFRISSKNKFQTLSYIYAAIQPSTVAAVHSNFFNKLSSSTNRHQNSRHSSAFSSPSFRSFHSTTLNFNSTSSSSVSQDSTKKRSGWFHETSEQVEERSEWSKWFKTKRLEKNSCQISFARSSGAGGQHVNKVETKAVVKLDLEKVMSGGKGWNKCQSNSNSVDGESKGIGKENGWLLFSVGKRLIEKSQYYILSSNSLQLSSMKTRSKDRNLEDALSKLHDHLLTIASDSLPSKDRDDQEVENQNKKVEKLKEKEDRKMKLVKERRGGVKSGRKGGKGELGW